MLPGRNIGKVGMANASGLRLIGHLGHSRWKVEERHFANGLNDLCHELLAIRYRSTARGIGHLGHLDHAVFVAAAPRQNGERLSHKPFPYGTRVITIFFCHYLNDL